MGKVTVSMIVFVVAYVAYTIAIVDMTRRRIESKTQSIFLENLELRDKIEIMQRTHERELQVMRDQNAHLNRVIKSLEEQIVNEDEETENDRDRE